MQIIPIGLSIKQQIIKLTFVISLAASVISPAYAGDKQQDAVIAITQISDHLTLDEIKQGIVNSLKDCGYSNHKNFVFANAHGNIALTNQIAKKFIDLSPDVMLAIGTPSAQAIHAIDKDKNIPLIFASLSDPVKAGIIPAFDTSSTFVTGTINIPPMDEQIAFIKKIMPKIKTIGVIANQSEVNSVVMTQQLRQKLEEENIKLIRVPLSNSSEIHQSANYLVSRVDAVYLQQDSLVASSLPSLMNIMNKHHIPVFASYDKGIEYGALFSMTINEYDMGYETGKIACRVLQGEKVFNIPPVIPKDFTIKINEEAMEAFNIKRELFRQYL